MSNTMSNTKLVSHPFSVMGMIRNAIAWTKIMNSVHVKDDILKVNFQLTLPKWANDEELLKGTDENTYIRYCRDQKNNVYSYIVNIHTVKDDYPSNLGKIKFLIKSKEYSTKSWCTPEFNFISYLRQERRNIFREVQAGIVLQEVGHYSKKWDDITSGRYPVDLRENYANTRKDFKCVQECNASKGLKV